MKIKCFLAVSVTAFTLLSCNDSDDALPPVSSENNGPAAITIKVKGTADTVR